MKTDTQSSRANQLSPSKKRAFTIVLILTPVLFFTVLEAALWLFGYGPDLSLFTTELHGGKTYAVMNPGVKGRYFYRVDFSPTASPDYFVTPKPKGTFRIFCLGGSTTVGYPYWFNGALSSFLRDRLQAIFPDKRFDVINVGMTATNSFTALDLAGDVMSYEPDLIIDYDGHNEFYGALGISSNESLGSTRWITLLYLKLIHLRTFILLRETVHWITGLFSSKSAALSRSGTLMEEMAIGQTVRYGDKKYLEAESIFRENLEDLRSLCLRHGVPLILGTQISNLRDRSPFISDDHASWPSHERNAYAAFLSSADTLLTAGRPVQARALLRGLIGKDPFDAQAHYLLAQTYDRTGLYDSARAEYILARDDDELRFRASSDFNDVVLSMDHNPEVKALDMERVFMEHSDHGLIGNQLITEHLHPNSRGNFLLGKAYVAGIRAEGLIVSPHEWAARDTVSDDRLWDERCVTDLDEIIAARRTDILTSGWPFINQYPTVDAVSPTDTLRSIAERVTRGTVDWKQAHQLAFQFYQSRGDQSKAERELRTIVNQIPLDVKTLLNLAHLYVTSDRLPQARELLIRSLDLEETPLAYRALGDIALRTGHPQDAVPFYEHLSLYPQSAKEQSENSYLLALAYLGSNRPQPAVKTLEDLLRLDPGNMQALTLLNRIRSLSK